MRCLLDINKGLCKTHGRSLVRHELGGGSSVHTCPESGAQDASAPEFPTITLEKAKVLHVAVSPVVFDGLLVTMCSCGESFYSPFQDKALEKIRAHIDEVNG